MSRLSTDDKLKILNINLKSLEREKGKVSVNAKAIDPNDPFEFIM